MTTDARFEDGREAPLNLSADTSEDVQVLSALCQDAVFPITEMSFGRKARRFALLLNRFRWEEGRAAQTRPERVQSVLVIEHVLGVASQGIDRADRDVILSLLSVQYEAGEDGAGEVLLTLAGDGAIRLHTEALEISLKDVTKPYVAPSGRVPEHDA